MEASNPTPSPDQQPPDSDPPTSESSIGSAETVPREKYERVREKQKEQQHIGAVVAKSYSEDTEALRKVIAEKDAKIAQQARELQDKNQYIESLKRTIAKSLKRDTANVNKDDLLMKKKAKLERRIQTAKSEVGIVQESDSTPSTSGMGSVPSTRAKYATPSTSDDDDEPAENFGNGRKADQRRR